MLNSQKNRLETINSYFFKLEYENHYGHYLSDLISSTGLINFRTPFIFTINIKLYTHQNLNGKKIHTNRSRPEAEKDISRRFEENPQA